MQGFVDLSGDFLSLRVSRFFKHLGHAGFRGTHGSFRGRKRLQKQQRRALLQLAKESQSDRIVSFEAGRELIDQASLHLHQRILIQAASLTARSQDLQVAAVETEAGVLDALVDFFAEPSRPSPQRCIVDFDDRRLIRLGPASERDELDGLGQADQPVLRQRK